MAKFQGVDYFDIDTLLSEEEILVRSTVREFVDDRVLPIIEQHNRAGSFPRELVAVMAQLGLLGPTLPAKYGCAEMNNVAYGLMMQELERGDSSIRSFASVQSALVMYPVFSYGSEEQKDYWLPRLASGETIGCFGLTEPDFGSNPGGMVTKAEERGDGYLLNGAKMWITNGSIADLAVVWAKLNGEIRGFLVEKGTKGFSAPEMKGKHSLRASVTSEFRFPASARPDTGLPGAPSARLWPVTMQHWTMPGPASSSTSRLLPSSLRKRSWCICSRRSPKRSSWPSSWGG
jgi:glutaryl-CoA dehydrogenase